MHLNSLLFTSYLVYILCNSLVKAYQSCRGNVSQEEYDVLQSIYEGTHGHGWNLTTCGYSHDKHEWAFPSPLSAPCSDDWVGINCTVTVDVEPPRCTIVALNLSKCNLTGTFPSDIYQMDELVILDVRYNQLQGSLPSEIGLLAGLIYLDASYNSFSLTIPSELGNNLELAFLNLYTNDFTGSIPESIGGLTKLEYLGLGDSYATGTIPPSYVQLTKVIYLSISYSMISGPIPTAINRLSSLKYFVIAENLCTGFLPEIGNMTKVVGLLINTNLLTGLPTLLPPYLEDIIAYNNHFEGTMPASIFQPHLTELLIYGNRMTGPFPETFGNASVLASMNVERNKFTGTIPSGLGLLQNLVFAVFNTNSFSGYLPTELSNAVNLEVLQIVGTFISGTIPSQFGTVSALNELYLTDAYLTGTIPSEIAHCQLLNTLELSQNYITGTLPGHVIQNISTMQSLNLTRNLMHGDITSLFENSFTDSTVQVLPQLFSVDLSYNAFTSTLPSAMFSLPSLSTLSLLMNCFEGAIIPEICNAETLQVVIMDGLSMASACTAYVPRALKGVVKGTFSNGNMGGSIPACVFQMPNLTTLHLSGNDLTGTIPVVPEDSPIIDLALSSNFLTGSIPTGFQRSGKLIQLNLGSNRLNGVLDENFNISSTATAIDISVNRISGPVPVVLLSFPGVNILSGNVFSCGALPSNDPATGSYLCGSLALNVATGVWFGFVCLVAILIAVFYIRGRRRQKEGVSAVTEETKAADVVNPISNAIANPSNNAYSNGIGGTAAGTPTPTIIHHTFDDALSWWNAQDLTKHSFATCMLLYILKAAAYVGCALAVVYVCILLTAYCLLKFYGNGYSTHTYQYAWLSTAAYLHGVGPVLLVVLALCVGAVFVTVFFFRVLAKLIRVSEHFAAKTREWEKQQAAAAAIGEDSLNGSTNSLLHGAAFVNSSSGHGEIELRSASTNTVTNQTTFADSNSNAKQRETGDIDIDTIYRSRSSIFNLFGSHQPSHLAQKSNISFQLNSAWVSGKQSNSNMSAASGSFSSSSNLKNSGMSSWTWACCCGAFKRILRQVFLHLLNAGMTLCLNGAYVALLLSSSLSSEALSAVQLLLGVYKVVWKSMVVPVLVAHAELSKADQISHQVFIDLFNFIAGPVLATLLSDSSCFLNVFQSMESVQSQYMVQANFYEVCPSTVNSTSSTLSISCSSVASEEQVTESVQPPWVYSFQCTSSIFVNYVPVLLYSFTLSGVLMPLVQCLLMCVQEEKVYSLVPHWCRKMVMVDKIQWPRYVRCINSKPLSPTAGGGDGITGSGTSTTANGSAEHEELIFNVGSLISTVVLHLSVLMTFGAASPVLGIAVAAGLGALTALWRLLVGRFLRKCRHPLPRMLRRLEDATTGICAGMFGCLRTLVAMVSIFWGVACFDMVADVYGLRLGIIATVCILCVVPAPFCLLFYMPTLASRLVIATNALSTRVSTWSIRDAMSFSIRRTETGGSNNNGLGTTESEKSSSFGKTVSSLHRTPSNSGHSITSAEGVDPIEYLRDSFALPKWTERF